MLRTILIASVLVLVAACGGGGGGGGGKAATAPAGSVRRVPGDSVAVTRASPLVAGQTCALRIRVVGGARPVRVDAWAGDEYAPPARPDAARDLGGGLYAVDLDVPMGFSAGTACWVRLTMADGGVIEAGRGCFALTGLPVEQ